MGLREYIKNVRSENNGKDEGEKEKGKGKRERKEKKGGGRGKVGKKNCDDREHGTKKKNKLKKKAVKPPFINDIFKKEILHKVSSVFSCN